MIDEAHDGRSAARETGSDELWREATSLESILVLSASLIGRAAIADALEAAGHRVRVAATPAEASRAMHQEMPDLAVVDLGAGEPSLLTAGAGLKAIAAPTRLPVLGLVHRRAGPPSPRPLGIDHALVAPFGVDQIRRAVQYLLAPFRTESASRPPRWAQLAITLHDRIEAAHLSLGTTLRARVCFDASPLNGPYVAELRGQLARLGVPAEATLRGGELEIAFHPTIAEAFALGFNRYAPDELFDSLLDCYPELGRDPEALAARVHELEEEYLRLQRLAS